MIPQVAGCGLVAAWEMIVGGKAEDHGDRLLFLDRGVGPKKADPGQIEHGPPAEGLLRLLVNAPATTEEPAVVIVSLDFRSGEFA